MRLLRSLLRRRLDILRWCLEIIIDRLPHEILREIISIAFKRRTYAVIEGFLPHLNRDPDLDTVRIDHQNPDGGLRFSDLGDLFLSNNLNHATLGLTIRMSAYIHNVCREIGAKKAIDVGAHKGGSAVLLAVAMGKDGIVWTLDNNEKEARTGVPGHRTYADQIDDFARRHALDIRRVVGDSRTLEIEDVNSEVVDAVLIDGGHTTEIVRSDFNRFGKRVRTGGVVFFDDCSGEGTFSERPAYMIPLLEEFLADGNFE